MNTYGRLLYVEVNFAGLKDTKFVVILDPTWSHDIIQKVFIRDGGDVDVIDLQGGGGDGLQEGILDDKDKGMPDVCWGAKADGFAGLGPIGGEPFGLVSTAALGHFGLGPIGTAMGTLEGKCEETVGTRLTVTGLSGPNSLFRGRDALGIDLLVLWTDGIHGEYMAHIQLTGLKCFGGTDAALGTGTLMLIAVMKSAIMLLDGRAMCGVLRLSLMVDGVCCGY